MERFSLSIFRRRRLFPPKTRWEYGNKWMLRRKGEPSISPKTICPTACRTQHAGCKQARQVSLSLSLSQLQPACTLVCMFAACMLRSACSRTDGFRGRMVPVFLSRKSPSPFTLKNKNLSIMINFWHFTVYYRNPPTYCRRHKYDIYSIFLSRKSPVTKNNKNPSILTQFVFYRILP